MSKDSLCEFLTSIGEKPFRGKQLYTWIYRRMETDFEAMTDLGKDLRAKLQQTAIVELPQIGAVQSTRDDSTRKYRLSLNDGYMIESVLMKEISRTTICVSTQVGCPLACRFCATGTMGFKRNLTSAEITGQYIAVSKHSGEDISNIVFMGMGEPLLNFDNCAQAILLLTDSDGLAVSTRKITVSTAGIIPGIAQMSARRLPCKLAISLNAPDDELRTKLMPINKKYPLEDLLFAAHQFEKTTRHRVTFEYILINGVNDTPEHARRLKKTLGGFTAKLNLIEYNPIATSSPGIIPANFKAPSPGTAEKFAAVMERPGLTVIIRKSLGGEISAACGQLCVK